MQEKSSKNPKTMEDNKKHDSENQSETLAKKSTISRFIDFIKNIYSKNAYVFIPVSVISAIIMFVVVEDGGSFFSRLIGFIVTFIIGGLLGLLFLSFFGVNKMKSFRLGAGSFLIFIALMAWANDGYVPSSPSNYHSGYPKPCKGTCGETIKSAKDDYDGYHLVCKPGKDGKSFIEKARGL